MRFQFSSKKLEQLYVSGEGQRDYPQEVVSAFLRRVRHIEAAKNEQDLRKPSGVHYEKLKGRYAGKNSMRLNKQWRLILSVEQDSDGKWVEIHDINNHYDA